MGDDRTLVIARGMVRIGSTVNSVTPACDSIHWTVKSLPANTLRKLGRVSMANWDRYLAALDCKEAMDNCAGADAADNGGISSLAIMVAGCDEAAKSAKAVVGNSWEAEAASGGNGARDGLLHCAGVRGSIESTGRP